VLSTQAEPFQTLILPPIKAVPFQTFIAPSIKADPFQTLGGVGAITIVKVLSVDDAPLKALIVRLAVPTSVGVPEMTPVEVFRLSPVAPLELTKE
jgi:hypothetical protein